MRTGCSNQLAINLLVVVIVDIRRQKNQNDSVVGLHQEDVGSFMCELLKFYFMLISIKMSNSSFNKENICYSWVISFSFQNDPKSLVFFSPFFSIFSCQIGWFEIFSFESYLSCRLVQEGQSSDFIGWGKWGRHSWQGVPLGGQSLFIL